MLNNFNMGLHDLLPLLSGGQPKKDESPPRNSHIGGLDLPYPVPVPGKLGRVSLSARCAKWQLIQKQTSELSPRGPSIKSRRRGHRP